jgi:hypothetical protein
VFLGAKVKEKFIVAQVRKFLLHTSLLEKSVSVTEFQATGANSSLVRTRAYEGVGGRQIVLWNQ